MELEYLEQISTQLGALHSLIVSVNMGLKAERMEEQVIDSIECIDMCVKTIKQFVDSKLG